MRRRSPEENHESEYFLVYEPYVSAIAKAGGVPLIIPAGLDSRTQGRILLLINGLVLAGGGDIDPNLYGDLHTSKLRRVEPRRDRCEIELFNLAFARNIPILGICRGIQVMNVALDGTLYQDITTAVRMAQCHDPEFPPDEPVHEVKVDPETKLSKALGEKIIWVNSRHHQAIKLHGKGLIVSAKSSDGIIEGIEHPNRKWVIGVQWHPESMWETDRIQARLFKTFVDACAG